MCNPHPHENIMITKNICSSKICYKSIEIIRYTSEKFKSIQKICKFDLIEIMNTY